MGLLRRKTMDSQGATTSHEGIKTVRADNRCDFSSYSDLCVSVVTWNMNGQVRSYFNFVSVVISRGTQISS